MTGFTRRFTDFPSVETIREIEGIVIVDRTAPGAINGIGSGVACVVGEFADVTYGVAIDSNGVVTTFPKPVEVFSGQDVIDKAGGFDETIGEFGGDGGSGWLELKNKAFSRLVLVPINIASSQGFRMFRFLPTNKSATDPSPVVPLVAGVVAAGREFRSGVNRIRAAQRFVFAETSDYARGTDGSVTSAGAAAFQNFVSAGGAFTTVLRPDGTIGVKVGDILVVGVIGAAGAQGANAKTLRVRSITNATTLVVEQLDGTNFDWTTGGAQAWRLHVAECADTGAATHVGTQAGYRIPARPLDATIAANTVLTPTVVPSALTADSADSLSGLGARTDPVTGLVFTAAVQGPNAVSAAGLDALYVLAIDALLTDDLPAREVNLVWPARYSSTIDAKVKSHVLAQKANGIGRMGIVSPPLDTLSLNTILGDAAPGSGNARAREVIYCWPGLQTFATEAVGKSIKGADGLLYTDGILDTPSSGWAAAVLSQLAPERNPGQAADPVQTVMANTLAIQRGVSGLTINAYKQLKAKGVMAPRNDRTVGRIFQSGVTRSNIDGEREIHVRRFSFFVQDSLAAALMPLVKLPLSESIKDSIVAAHVEFFELLLARNNTQAQRIVAYEIDTKSGNTPALARRGIYVVIHRIEMLPIAEVIVLQSEVGYGFVNVTQLAA